MQLILLNVEDVSWDMLTIKSVHTVKAMENVHIWVEESVSLDVVKN